MASGMCFAGAYHITLVGAQHTDLGIHAKTCTLNCVGGAICTLAPKQTHSFILTCDAWGVFPYEFQLWLSRMPWAWLEGCSHTGPMSATLSEWGISLGSRWDRGRTTQQLHECTLMYNWVCGYYILEVCASFTAVVRKIPRVPNGEKQLKLVVHTFLSGFPTCDMEMNVKNKIPNLTLNFYILKCYPVRCWVILQPWSKIKRSHWVSFPPHFNHLIHNIRRWLFEDKIKTKMCVLIYKDFLIHSS